MTPRIDKKLELEDIDVILSFESIIGLLVYYLKQGIRNKLYHGFAKP